MTFGEMLLKTRKKLGLTQQQVAEKVGVHRVTITTYERGTDYPRLDTALKISKALGFSLDQLKEGGR